MGGGLANPEATAYLPLSSPEPDPVSFAVRIRGEEAGRTARQLREIAAQTRDRRADRPHATPRRTRIAPCDQLAWPCAHALFVMAIAILSLSVLLLAIAGLYALMSFTVVRRRREIGIRIALGARPHSVVGGVLERAAWQLAIGMAAGLAVTGVVDRLLAGGEIQGGREGLLLAGVVAVMTVVGILAAWGSARRGLAIQPSEALRAE